MNVFLQPYFITPHAVQRFQERIANIPAAEVIDLIQSWLQGNPEAVDWQEWKGELCPIYRFKYRNKPVYVPVRPGEKRWPAIPTILGPDSRLHQQLSKNLEVTYSITDVAYILNVNKDTVAKWIDKGLLKCKRRGGWRSWKPSKIKHTDLILFLRKNPDKWNAANMQINLFGYSKIPNWFAKKERIDKKNKMANKTWKDYEIYILKNNYHGNPKEVAKLINRSPRSIKIKYCRLKKEGLL